MADPATRLLMKADTTGGDGSCWPFTGARKPANYGNFYLDGRYVGAHVAAYLLFVGEVPEGKQIDHTCHDPEVCPGGNTCPHRACVNWRHLEPKTHRENSLRSCGISAINLAKTHCCAGHEYTDENTYRAPGSPQDRHCRECMRSRTR